MEPEDEAESRAPRVEGEDGGQPENLTIEDAAGHGEVKEDSGFGTQGTGTGRAASTLHPPPSTSDTHASRLTPEEENRRLAQELARRGVPPDEVARLIALGGAPAPEPAPQPQAAPVVAPPLEVPPSEPFVPHPTITLPEFREATSQQRVEADRLLTTANVARRRGNYREAERACREALERTPSDAAALELYGDILRDVGRVDDAVFTYQRAQEADPKRLSAERKYAELMLLQNREVEMLREEYIPRNPNVAVFFSALFPGAGQMYNGESLKGLLVALAMLACVMLLGWSPWGFPGSEGRLTGPMTVLLLLTGAVYIYAVADANVGARRNRRPKSGWEV